MCIFEGNWKFTHTLNTLRERGADAAITELNGATHLDVPALAYKDPDLLQWLIGNENT